MIKAGATGTIASEDGTHLSLEHSLIKNEGTLTIGKSSGLTGISHAELVNSGTLIVNGEPSSENHGLNASAGSAQLTNTGTVKKTEGAGTTQVGFTVSNEGTISAFSGKLAFAAGGTSGIHGSYSASGAGVGLVAESNGETLALGSVSLSGSASLEVTDGTATTTGIEAAAGSVAVSRVAPAQGTLEVNGISTLQSLTLTGGRVTGAGTVDITGALTAGANAGHAGAVFNGSGTTVIEPGAVGTVVADKGAISLWLEGWKLINEGTTTVVKEGGIQGEKEALLQNFGTLIVNGEPMEEAHGLRARPVDEKVYLENFGTLEKTEGTGVTTIEFDFESFGPIEERTGSFYFTRPLIFGSEALWGGEEDPSAPNRELAMCGEGVSCGGNFSQSQTDLAIGGRGVGLELARNYNSQAAAAKVHGAFGYGWSSSFSDHLVLEPTLKLVTLVQANGSSVPFTEGTGGALTAPAWSQDTLTGSATLGYTLTLEDQTVYKFADATGRLESVTDRNGNATTLAYGAEGRLESITDPASRKITLAYNAEGLVESATDPMKHVVKYAYEGGNLKSVTQPGAESLRWQFKYDDSHEMTEMVDGRGGKTTNKYNGSHQDTEQTDPMSRLTTFEYAPFRTATTNHATGAETVQYLSTEGQPTSVTKGYGTSHATTESSAYDAKGELLSTSDGNGHTTRFGYDTHDDRTSLVDPEGHETKWTYDATHDIETETKPNEEKTTYKRDSHGNPEVIERPAPGKTTQATSYKYDSHGDVESVTDPLKRVSKYEYDIAGDRTAETDPEGDKRTWAYDEDSQATSMVSPRGHVKAGEESKYTTKTERDAQGRPIKVTDPLSHETKYKYDGDGNLETKTDPEGHETTYTYDADNERTKVKEASGTVTETGYDGAGQVTSQTDGNKHVTKYERNILEQITEVVDPLGRKTTKEYDKAGNLTSLTDAAKRTTTYKYSAATRLTQVSYSDGKTHAVNYEYNADGDRTKMEDASGTTGYEWDQLDRLTGTKDGHGDTAAYEYDLANEQTKITYPNGKAVTRAYDNAGRLKSTTDWLEHTTKFIYDADGDLKASTFPTGTTNEDTYAYDETDAMKEVKMLKGAETLASLVYTRTKDGQVKGITSKGLPGEEKPAYEYDANSRLTKGAGISYKYDNANNTEVISANTLKYDNAGELERSEATVGKALVANYTYNEVGQRTKLKPATGPATTYEYDQAANLTSITRPKEGSTAAIEDTYAYNGDGLRTAQTVSGSTTYLTWDRAETLPLILNDGTNSYLYGPGGLPIEQINNTTGTVLYLHHDQAGSVRLLTGKTGTVEGKCTYNAYGARTCEGTATTPLGYDGQYTDTDTGLIYLRARYYDPTTAQFLTVDPAVSVTQAPYTYARDNPLNDSDPSGLNSTTEEERAFERGFNRELARWRRKLGHNYSHARELWHEVLIYGFYKELVEIGGRGEESEAFRTHLKSLEQQYARLSRAAFDEVGKLQGLETGLSWAKAISLIYSVAKEVL